MKKLIPTILLIASPLGVLHASSTDNTLNDSTKSLNNSSFKLESVVPNVSVIQQAASRSVQDVSIASKNNSAKISRRSVVKESAKNNTEKHASALNKQQIQKQPIYRSQTPQKSHNAHNFVIYEAWTSLDYDHDGDGYYSEFTVNFDPNYSGGYAEVFADLYLSKNGGPWVLYKTTDTFTIYGNDSDDYYSVTTRLNYDFPTDHYDVLIDLYEYGDPDFVDTVDADIFNSLYALPLEDNEHELNSDSTLITYVSSELSEDGDRDGFYTHLSLTYDIDTYAAGRNVYAKVVLLDTLTFNSSYVETENFVLGNQTEYIDIYFENGQIPGWYDVQIQLIDVVTNQIIANAAQDFSALSQLGIESHNYDFDFDVVGTDSDPIHREEATHSHESGGGAMGWFIALLSGLIVISRRQSKN
ncbi:choice-of-anchor H family protein [Aliikangiella maris]|uniref:Choice-of-anchor H family protein n=2 Tax=Aliikangiella maris TaxID=3162458 RepID=A0ABV3MMK0_9GAMM